MCKGNFQEEEKRPPAGTPCVGLCVMEAGIWGSSYCYTDLDEYQWGVECVSCQGLQYEEHLIFFNDHNRERYLDNISFNKYPYPKSLGVCTGTYKEDDGENGTLRAAPGTICKSDCVIEDGYWGSSFCYTEADHSQWGAECVICKYSNDLIYVAKLTSYSENNSDVI